LRFFIFSLDFDVNASILGKNQRRLLLGDAVKHAAKGSQVQAVDTNDAARRVQLGNHIQRKLIVHVAVDGQ
jgi:hypothetical protein